MLGHHVKDKASAIETRLLCLRLLCVALEAGRATEGGATFITLVYINIYIYIYIYSVRSAQYHKKGSWRQAGR